LISHPDDLMLEGLVKAFEDDENWTVLEHLATCRPCQRRLEILVEKRKARRSPLEDRLGRVLPWPAGDAEYDGTLDRVFDSVLELHSSFERERGTLPTLLAELLATNPEERRRLVAREPRFRTWALLDGLLEQSRAEAFLDPQAAESLAELALLQSETLTFETFGPAMLQDARARCWAHIGNARRLQSNLQAAEVAFKTAHHHLQQGTGDAMERAQLSELKASLLSDQRRFEEALRLLRRGIALYRQAGERHRVGRSLVQMSTVHHYSGDLERAISVLSEAIPLIDPRREPRLLLCARHNLIDYLAEVGRFMEAKKLFSEARSLYGQFPDAWAQNRRDWVRGKIARGLGQHEEAERAFIAAREGFVEEGVAYDAALASLDLALVYAEGGRVADLVRLAHEMAPIFLSRQIHREALAALSFLRQAIEAQRAERALVERVANFLKRAQHDPECRFEAP
jgi:tetratricopeptide (TPR) repeat protein